jgi:hypothetical protein
MDTLAVAVMLRQQLPHANTLFLPDEMEQFENILLLESILTLIAGYGRLGLSPGFGLAAIVFTRRVGKQFSTTAA